MIMGAGTPLAVQLRDMSAVSFTDTEESIPGSLIIAGAVVKITQYDKIHEVL